MTTAPTRLRAPVSAIRRLGFQAKISGATISDLVQMECLAGARRVVRVTTDGDAGFLYFRDGRIVHAVTRSAEGEAACLLVLQWDNGAFEVIDREWPEVESLTCSWQSLLLRAAQVHDEESPEARASLAPELTHDMDRKPPFEATPIVVFGRQLQMDDFRFAVSLNRNGDVLWQRGASAAIADAMAYALRLLELVGDDLGLEDLRAMECRVGKATLFLVTERNGNAVVLEPQPHAELASLRQWFGV